MSYVPSRPKGIRRPRSRNAGIPSGGASHGQHQQPSCLSGEDLTADNTPAHLLAIHIQSALLGRYMINPYPTKADYQDMSAELKIRMARIREWFKIQRRRDILRGVVCVPCKSFRANHLMSYWSPERRSPSSLNHSSPYSPSSSSTSSSPLPEDHPADLPRPCFRFHFFNLRENNNNNNDNSPGKPQLIGHQSKESGCQLLDHRDPSKMGVIRPKPMKLLMPSGWTEDDHQKMSPNNPLELSFASDSSSELLDPGAPYVYYPSLIGQHLSQDVQEELHSDC